MKIWVIQNTMCLFFLNIPFDESYKHLFYAMVFAVTDCGFIAKCAFDNDDGSEVRIDKLYQIISECKYGIHDISRVQLDRKNKLPRFNMPLELGIFLGAKYFGNNVQGQKVGLILEKFLHRFQIFCSDIAGQDIRAHSNNDELVIKLVRNWLGVIQNKKGIRIPGPRHMYKKYKTFRKQLPSMCRNGFLIFRDLSFIDFRTLATGWLKTHP